MPQNHLLLVSAAANGPGAIFWVPAEMANRSFVVNLTGTGPVSATVSYEVSNDNGVTWATRLTFNLSGTNLKSDADVDANSPFTSVRGTVSNLSGTGAAVSLSLCAA